MAGRLVQLDQAIDQAVKTAPARMRNALPVCRRLTNPSAAATC